MAYCKIGELAAVSVDSSKISSLLLSVAHSMDVTQKEKSVTMEIHSMEMVVIAAVRLKYAETDYCNQVKYVTKVCSMVQREANVAMIARQKNVVMA